MSSCHCLYLLLKQEAPANCKCFINVCLSADELFNLSTLTGTFSQVEELSPADFTASYDLDIRDVGAVDRENPLNSYAVRDSPYGESLGDVL